MRRDDGSRCCHFDRTLGRGRLHAPLAASACGRIRASLSGSAAVSIHEEMDDRTGVDLGQEQALVPGHREARMSDPPEYVRSFEDFFEIERDPLLGALYLITGNRHDAEELMQEAFLRIWERWDVVESLANPTGYLYRTAMNIWRMRRRRLRLAARHVLPMPSQRDLFAEAEMREDVRRHLVSLTPRQRAAVVLTELLGYPAGEAAKTLGIAPSTVRALTTQARIALRSSIGDDRE
jgi:RNA polymerase sigma-70 factor (ECF subfamily)